MPVTAVEILCLANSRKHSGRCVAGLRLDGGGWVRPVGMGGDGALFRPQIRLPDGAEPRPLDVLRIGLRAPCPKPYHPEDWTIDGSPWERAERPSEEAAALLLDSHTRNGPGLLGGLGPKVAPRAFAALARPGSLEIVRPQAFHWKMDPPNGPGAPPRLRAVFTLRGERTYRLAVTDTVWEERLAPLPPGEHAPHARGLGLPEGAPPPRLVISLTEPVAWDGLCYKVVAAVLPEGASLSAPAASARTDS